jgi:Flp pilus assembly protein TadD
LFDGLKHSPQDAFLLTLLGTARSNEADLRAAIEADPDLPEAYINLGTILARKGQRDEAIALFRKALEVDPQSRAAEGNLRLALSGAAR